MLDVDADADDCDADDADDCDVYANADANHRWHDYAHADACAHVDVNHLHGYVNVDACEHVDVCHDCGDGGVAVVGCLRGCGHECVDAEAAVVVVDRLFFVSVCRSFCSQASILLNKMFRSVCNWRSHSETYASLAYKCACCCLGHYFVLLVD